LITDEKSKLNPAGSASIMVQKYLRPAAIKAGVIKEDERVRFGFHKSMASRNTVHRRTHSDHCGAPGSRLEPAANENDWLFD